MDRFDRFEAPLRPLIEPVGTGLASGWHRAGIGLASGWAGLVGLAAV